MIRSADVLVVGAGPTGLTLALQANAHGARVRVIEQRLEMFRPSRALILHPRTLEVLRPLGVTEALIARAISAPEACVHLDARVVHVRLAQLALADTPFPHLSLIRQMDVETVLYDALRDRGVQVERGVELIEVCNGAVAARATLRSRAGLERIDCAFVAGCDGPASTVRRAAHIGWIGAPYAEDVVLADVELDGNLAAGVAQVAIGRRGILFVFPLGERGTWRLLATLPAGRESLAFGQPGPAVARAELQALLDDSGLDARLTDLAWCGRYRVQHRLASAYRQGRLFIAGDAAHAFSPATGQGMNTGIQDAINLGWKLAFAASAGDRAALLDSYSLERRPVARQALALTHLVFWMEASAARLPSLLRGVLARIGAPAAAGLLGRRRLVAGLVRSVSQLRVAYPHSPLSIDGRPRPQSGPGVGYRVPDATVSSRGHCIRLHELLARPGIHVLLHRDAHHLEDLDLGRHVTVHRLMSVPGTGLIAVRPDGYVGFRCQVADVSQLRNWLWRVGVDPCHQTEPAAAPIRLQASPTRRLTGTNGRVRHWWSMVSAFGATPSGESARLPATAQRRTR